MLASKMTKKIIKSKSTESATTMLLSPSKTAATPSEETEETLWPAELMEQVFRGILNALNQDVTLVTIVNSTKMNILWS